MKKYFMISFILLLTISFLGSGLVKAESEMNFEMIELDGYTNYEIYDDSLTWKSLLEFPLDTSLLSLEYKYFSDINTLFSKNNKKIPFYFNYQVSIKDKNDKRFKDSDWLNSNFDKDPIIYAEAKSKINATIIDLNTIFYKNVLNNNGKVNIGLGYENKEFDYTAYNAFIDDNYNNTAGYIKEDVIEYNVKYYIPYVLANYKIKYNGFGYNIGMRYSPIVNVEDWDYHILRDKTSESETNGDMFSYNIGINNEIKNNWLIKLNYTKTSIETKGKQTQTFSDGRKISDITSEIYMESAEFTFTIIHLF